MPFFCRFLCCGRSPSVRDEDDSPSPHFTSASQIQEHPSPGEAKPRMFPPRLSQQTASVENWGRTISSLTALGEAAPTEAPSFIFERHLHEQIYANSPQPLPRPRLRHASPCENLRETLLAEHTGA
eukprot:RCo044544